MFPEWYENRTMVRNPSLLLNRVTLLNRNFTLHIYITQNDYYADTAYDHKIKPNQQPFEAQSETIASKSADAMSEQILKTIVNNMENEQECKVQSFEEDHSKSNISFTTIAEQYLKGENPDPRILPDLNHYLKLSKKHEKHAFETLEKCQEMCPQCLQTFSDTTQVLKHQKKDKKGCTAVRFLIHAISTLPEYSSLIARKQVPQTLFINMPLMQLMNQNSSPPQIIFSTKEGVAGALVESVGRTYTAMKQNEPFHFIGEHPLTKADIHLIVSGAHFDYHHKSSVHLREPYFKPGDTWIQGIHIDMLRELIYKDGNLFDDMTGKIKHILLTPSLFTYLCSDSTDTEAYLRNTLRNNEVYVEQQLIAENFLVPVNLSNTHWILIALSTQRLTFCVLNPYHPQQPSAQDLEIGQKVASFFAKTFGFSDFLFESSSQTKNFPIQHKNDSINCGVYIMMYALAFIDELSNPSTHLPFSVEEFRILLAAWFLTKSKPSFKKYINTHINSTTQYLKETETIHPIHQQNNKNENNFNSSHHKQGKFQTISLDGINYMECTSCKDIIPLDIFTSMKGICNCQRLTNLDF